MKSNPLKNFVGHLRPRSGQENSHSVENTSISGLWKYHNRRRVNCLFIVILDRDWPHFLNSKSFLSESIFRSIWQKDNLGTRESVCGSSAVFAPIRPRWVRLISPPDVKKKQNKKEQKRRKRKKNTVSVTSWARLTSAQTAKENWKTNSTETRPSVMEVAP